MFELTLCMVMLFYSCSGFLPKYGEYYEPGHIVIGVYMPLSLKCDVKMYGTEFLRVLGVVKAFERVNSNPDYGFLKSQIKLGFYILDTCYSSYRIFGFMRFTGPGSINDDKSCRHYVNGRQRTCKTKSSLTNTTNFYSIVGAIGPSYSPITVHMATFLQNFQIPQISPHATTDELTKKSKYPYLLRLVASDKYQAKALVSIVDYFNINSLVIVYYSDSYGISLLNLFRLELATNRTCISYEIDLKNEATLQTSIDNLLVHANYITYIVYIAKWHNKFLERIANSRFILISSDATYAIPKLFPNVSLLSISMSLGNSIQTQISDLYNDLTVDSVRQYPFGQEFWENEYDCQFNGTKRSCLEFPTLLAKQHDMLNGEIYLDAVDIFARALTIHLNRSNCRFILKNLKIKVAECIDTHLLFTLIRDIKFQGLAMNVSFNADGDSKPYYSIYQQKSTETVEHIGSWTLQNRLQINQSSLKSFESVLKLKKQCKSRCGYREVKKFVINCCFECILCADNAIPSADRYRCEDCPEFYWPVEQSISDQERCNFIRSVYITLKSSKGILCYCLSVCGVCSTVPVLIIYVLYRQTQLLKAGSVPLSCVTLVGLIMVHLSLIIFVGKPSIQICRFQIISNHCSIGMVYNSILVKAYRIHRLFTKASRGVKHIRFTSTLFVMILTALLSCFDVLLITGLQFVRNDLDRPSSTSVLGFRHRNMPSRTDKYVEEKCITDQFTMWIPLTWNSLKLIVCCLLAWLCYNLPDNFHDSRYILTFAGCSILLWIAFVPALLASSTLFMESLLSFLALFISAMLVLSNVFLPKVYAVYQQIKNPLPCSTLNSMVPTEKSVLTNRHNVSTIF